MFFNPHYLQIKNESHLHPLGEGADTHFNMVIVCSQFEGIAKMARHRLVYQSLQQDIEQGIHALVLHTYTPKEWQNISGTVPNSPNCLGIGQ